MYAEALIAASLLIAGYQDVKDRLVSDLVWIPAGVGVILVFALAPLGWAFLAVRLGLISAIAIAFTKYGSIGQADAIALVVVSADPSPLSPMPPLIATGAIALIHIGYLYLTGQVGKPIIIPLSRFKAEAKWIPKAEIRGEVKTSVVKDVNVSRDSVEALSGDDVLIEVQYGVPTVAYIGTGYFAYLVYLLIFQPDMLLNMV